MQYLSKTKLKLFTSLRLKKFRYEHQLLVVEGVKMVREALEEGLPVEAVLFRDDRAVDLAQEIPPALADRFFLLESEEFMQLASLESPEGVLAVIGFPGVQQVAPIAGPVAGPGLILDRIQDPGNLGTILRTADWFGLRQVLALKGTVDWSNPKTLRASMGAVFRVSLRYASPDELDLVGQIWAATMEGESLIGAPLAPQDWVLLGNEAQGISPELFNHLPVKKIRIPGRGGAESLNVAIAAGIFAFQLYQQSFK